MMVWTKRCDIRIIINPVFRKWDYVVRFQVNFPSWHFETFFKAPFTFPLCTEKCPATKILLLITDAPPKVRDVSVDATATAVKDAGIDSLNLVIQRFDQDVYKPLLTAGTAAIPGASTHRPAPSNFRPW